MCRKSLRYVLLLLALFIVSGTSWAEVTEPESETAAVDSSSLQAKVVVSAATNNDPLVRIKDLARVQGVRSNQIYGLGLVVGLDGTGDGRGTQANIQMLANALAKFGITVSADDLRLKNVAAVMVTANLGPFVHSGDTIDITVSSIGDAKSLQGGFLLQTPLKAADDEVYAVAQGPLSIGGFNVRGGGSSAQKNHPTVAMIPNGAIVEREVPMSFAQDSNISLLLSSPDFTTASRVASAVNDALGLESAVAVDGGRVSIEIPVERQTDVVGFIAELEEITLRPDISAKVIINERTGTVVIGHNVRISTVAVAHGSLKVRIGSQSGVSQPNPLSGGQTEVVEQVDISAEEEKGQLTTLPSGTQVSELVAALNAVGVGPRDIITILQAIKAAGALYADLEII